jgi:hypothetical protein
MLLSILLAVILIVSIVVNVLLFKALRGQLKRVDLYEKWIGEYDQWVADVRKLVGVTYLRMKAIDDKGLFFKDDDVGFVFTELLNLLKQLKDRVEK